MVPTLIQNVTIYTPTEVFAEASVVFDDGVIQAVQQATDATPASAHHVIDGSGYLLAPGFIDLQLNGGFGDDFTANPERIWQVAQRLPASGVTAFLPTIITSPLDTIQRAQHVLAAGPPTDFSGAQPVGLHLEGPFLNPIKKGAHNEEHLRRPSLEVISDWTPETHVRLVTLAPELPYALDAIDDLVAAGVVVSVGHTDASYEEGFAAFQQGARYGTHLFNAMRSIHHREPGIAAALLADSRITIGIIPDGIHVHPAMVKLAWSLCGDRLNLVTDAMAALGMPPGPYELGDKRVMVSEEKAQLADGTLAGSILPMDAALRNLLDFTGCSLEQALQTITTTPAKLLGIAKHKGQIAKGYDADMVLLTPDLAVRAAIVSGQIVYQDADLPLKEVSQ